MRQVGLTLGIIQLCSAPIGLLFGTWLTEHLAKKHDDANMRVLAICYTINPLFAIAGPLMPNPWMAVACGAISFAFGLAGAVPQNAALQSVTPNEMRGQVTALYLFIFTVIAGGLGPTFIAVFTDFVIGDEQQIRYAISLSAAIMMPIAATIMWLGVKPYGREIAKIKVLERQGLR
jgi:MFS family permease